MNQETDSEQNEFGFAGNLSQKVLAKMQFVVCKFEMDLGRIHLKPQQQTSKHFGNVSQTQNPLLVAGIVLR